LRRLRLEGGSVAVTSDDEVTSDKLVWQMEERIRDPPPF
jgi:transposase